MKMIYNIDAKNLEEA